MVTPLLDDVPTNELFRTCNGIVLHNLYELATFLNGCSEYDFRYHVNQDHHKNDFAIWIRETIHDEKLAHTLDSTLDKTDYLHTIKERLRTLTA